MMTITLCDVAKETNIILLIIGVNGNLSNKSCGILLINNNIDIIIAPKTSKIIAIVNIKIEIHELAAIPITQKIKPMV